MHKIDDISFEQIFSHMDSFNQSDMGKLDELKKASIKDNIPIIKDDVANFLYFTLKVINPKNILEIGTAVGYSAILFAKSCNAMVDTIEKDESIYSVAQNNVKDFSLDSRINLHLGDARQVIPNLEKKYDFVFIDASKSHYEEFYQLSKGKALDKALFVFDNILYKGYVFMEKNQVPKNKRTIYTRLNEFLDKVKATEKDYDLLPLGDGLLMILNTK